VNNIKEGLKLLGTIFVAAYVLILGAAFAVASFVGIINWALR